MVWDLAWAQLTLGTIHACQGRREEALSRLQDALAFLRRFAVPGGKLAGYCTGQYRRIWNQPEWVSFVLARAYLAGGHQSESLEQFSLFLSLATTSPGPLAAGLAGAEEAYGDAAAFRAFCRRFRDAHPEAGHPAFVQWFLEPADCQAADNSSSLNLQSEGWVWQSPGGDDRCSAAQGWEIHAANGRDLWDVNLTAPRLLRPALGMRAARTTCVPAEREKPAMGGLLLWNDAQNFLRLDRGVMGREEISFLGCLGNQEVIIGRGRLPGERISLRLERIGERMNALCSADGEEWFTVGHVEFPVGDLAQVGMHAIGAIDRTVYPGAYPEGTAIRFENFQLWA
jgi:hypothetical protein